MREEGTFTPGHCTCVGKPTCDWCRENYSPEILEAVDRLASWVGEDPAPDDITAPDYYVKGRKYEPRRVIQDWKLNFNAGSVVKYMSRYERKEDPLKDLRKARQYLDFEIERLEGE